MTTATPSPLGLDFEEPTERLAEAYAPCFTLALQLRATDQYGDAETLRQRVKALLEMTRREAIAAGLPPEDVSEAEFALVAFLDETVLSSEWSQKDQWLARPLQLELFNRYDAGEEFFSRLDGLRANPGLHDEAIEVYYLCMALGFKGRYQLHGQEDLRRLIDETGAEVMERREADVLAPHGAPRGPVAADGGGGIPGWALLAGAALLAFVVYLGLSLLISGSADGVAETIDAMAGRAPASGR